jgi:cytochrome c551/c552
MAVELCYQSGRRLKLSNRSLVAGIGCVHASTKGTEFQHLAKTALRGTAMTAKSNRKSLKGIFLWLAAAALSAAVGLIVALPHAVAQVSGPGSGFVAGDPKAGMQIFIQKGCAHCHPLFSEGSRGAPNLARALSSHATMSEVVAEMWNHAPAMWKEMKAMQKSLPKFTDAEMTSLLAFLYLIRSADKLGDQGRGRRLLVEKGCVTCHKIGRQGGRVGPDLRTLREHRLNLVSWSRAVWNHAPAMEVQMASRGIPWPELQDTDVTDIISHLQGSDHRALRILPLRPADAEAGRALFKQKGCVSCHNLRDVGATGAHDLIPMPLPGTLAQFVARMWNHIPAMRARMQARNILHAEFSDQEMADLLAYLFVERFFETKGNPTIGRELFNKKGCGSCHTVEGESATPRLSPQEDASAQAHFATVVWNHGPTMYNTLGDRVDLWPQFWPGEMADLIAYLASAGSVKQRTDNRR